jgi:hypothetical protein
MDITLNFDKRNLAIVVLILLLGFGISYHFYIVSKNKDQIKQEKNLQHALTDTVRTYRNKENQWVSEKLTLQADTKDLKDKNLTLTNNQIDLMGKVDQINKHNQVISAALIQMGVKIDGLANADPIVQTDSTVEFAAHSDSLSYDILISRVKPIGRPVLEFKKFTLPNTQLVEFHWRDDRKEGYPISFTVTNSNPYYKVYNLDSYAIPELDKTKIKPTFWNKLGTFSKSTGGKIMFLGIGFVAGAALMK